MTKILPVIIATVVLAALSHYFSDFDYEEQKYNRKEWFFWTLLTVVLIFFCGLRTKYNDTYAYIHTYEIIEPDQSIFNLNWRLGANPGFNAINILLVRLGFSTQSYLLFHAAFTIGVYMWFLRKYTNNLFLTGFFLLTMGCYVFTMAAIKQCIAMAFGLIATDFLIRKKYIGFILSIFLGSFFHPYVLLYLFGAVLSFVPWSIYTYVFLFSFLLAGFLLRPLMNSIVTVANLVGDSFEVIDLSGEGVNPIRLLIVSVPVFLSFLVRRQILEESSEERASFINMNLTMLNATIMYVALFGTANFFARLANYFLPFQTISLPWLFKFFNEKSRRFISIASVICFFFMFFYENVINLNFDSLFSSVSLWSYFKSIF